MAEPQTPSSDAPLVVEHVNHRYGNRQALHDVSLDVRPGERFGLLGPNGSGKSTLFKLISTLVPIQSGKISVFGRDAGSDRSAVRSAIGVVFQNPALDKQLTVTENVATHAALFGIDRLTIASRTSDLLHRFGLADRTNERVVNLSGGTRRKVELVKVLLPQPRLLLLDEPSSGLDVTARIELWRILDELRSSSAMTVVLTTHLMDEADRCDRIAILDAGRLLDCRPPEEFKSRLGGDVITLATKTPDAVAAALQTKLGLDAQRFGEIVRIEREQAHLLIPQIIEAVPGEIESVSVGRPTLDDVFIRLTGRGLYAADDSVTVEPADRRHS